MAVDERTDVRNRLRGVEERSRPDVARESAIAELDEIFRSGGTPDPIPDGMLHGRLLTPSLWAPLDALGRRVAAMWMPWLGKTFDSASMTGINVLASNARGALRFLWPNYEPERDSGDRIEAFPFRNRVAPGELDPAVDVLKIDYDFEANPKLLIRRILDELVQVEDDLYLGKILLRRQGAWAAIGYFTLERRAAD